MRSRLSGTATLRFGILPPRPHPFGLESLDGGLLSVRDSVYRGRFQDTGLPVLRARNSFHERWRSRFTQEALTHRAADATEPS